MAIGEKRAKALITKCLFSAAQMGRVRQVSPGKVWVMVIKLIDGGPRYQAHLNEENFESINQLAEGRVSRDVFDRCVRSLSTIWLFSAVLDGEAVYSELTELQIQPQHAERHRATHE